MIWNAQIKPCRAVSQCAVKRKYALTKYRAKLISGQVVVLHPATGMLCLSSLLLTTSIASTLSSLLNRSWVRAKQQGASTLSLRLYVMITSVLIGVSHPVAGETQSLRQLG